MLPSNTTDPTTPLPQVYAWFSALVLDDTSQMAQLLALGLNVDVCHPLRHTTALMEATRLGRTAMIQWLLHHGASPALLNGMPQGTALHYALRRKRWDIADLLIQATNSPGITDAFGNTPLHMICMEQQDGDHIMMAMDAVNLLVGKGCVVDALNHEGLSALHYTALNDDRHLLELMLVHGANPNIATPDEGATPLMIAALEQSTTLCALLLQHGADRYQRNRYQACAADMFAGLKKMGGDHALSAADNPSPDAMMQKPIRPV